jgi:hypothetical protein
MTATRRTRRVFAALTRSAAALAAPLAAVAAQQRPPAVSAGRAIAQGAVGLVAMPVGFVGGGLTTRWAAHRFGASDDAASRAALVGAYSIAALTTAAGPAIVGPGPHATASYPAALAGTVAGGIGSILLIRLNKAVNTGPVLRILSGLAVVLLPPAGATIGYDVSRKAHNP